MSNKLREFHGDVYYLISFTYSPTVSHLKLLTFLVPFTALNDAD